MSVRVLIPGAPWTERGTVVTDAAGRFRLAVPTGPSRTFRVRHERLVHSVTVRVIPRVAISAARDGRIAGRVYGARAGARKAVALQALRRGVWRTAATVRLGVRGTFRGRVAAPGALVRALVRSAPGWPFETGRSPGVRVPRSLTFTLSTTSP